MQSIKNEESFDGFYDVVLFKVKEYRFTSEPIVRRKQRVPALYEMGDAEPNYPTTARDYYRKIYFEAEDLLISSIL